MSEVTVIAAGFATALAHRDRPGSLALLGRLIARGELRDARGEAPYAPLLPWQRMLLAAVTPGLAAAEHASAPVSWLGLGGAPHPGWCLHAQPVHFIALADRLQLSSAGEVEPTIERELAAALAHGLAADTLWFETSARERWFLHSARRLEVATVPIEHALAADLREAMPVGKDAADLRRTMTEAQMLLAGEPANERRALAGEAPVNGVWCWGGGGFPDPLGSHDLALFGNDPYPQGLARLMGLTPQPAEWPQVAATFGGHARSIIVVEVDAPERLERDWLAPLLEELARGTITRLTLGLERHWLEITRRHLRRFWRRTHDVAEALK